jgi:cytochrome b561
MAVFNTETEFGTVAKFFHWTIAIFIIFLIPLGFCMVEAKTGATKGLLYGIHKSCGLTVLFLLILRYLWRMTNTRPKYPVGTPVWRAKIANWSHASMYLLLLLQTLTGWIMSTASGYPPNFWWIVQIPTPWVSKSATTAKICSFIHTYCAWVLVGVICLHILGALSHWWFRRDGVFQRMQPNFTKKKRFYDKT